MERKGKCLYITNCLLFHHDYYFGLHMQGCNELFKAEDFTPYDPTQDVIFPPELMVSQPMAWGTDVNKL